MAGPGYEVRPKATPSVLQARRAPVTTRPQGCGTVCPWYSASRTSSGKRGLFALQADQNAAIGSGMDETGIRPGGRTGTGCSLFISRLADVEQASG